MPPRTAALAAFALLAAVTWSGAIGATAYIGLALVATMAAVLVKVRAPAWAYPLTLAAWVVAVALLAGLGPPAGWPAAFVRGSESVSSGTPATGYDLRAATTV